MILPKLGRTGAAAAAIFVPQDRNVALVYLDNLPSFPESGESIRFSGVGTLNPEVYGKGSGSDVEAFLGA